MSEPSYAYFIALLDNYNVRTGQAEPQLTAAELEETDRFLNHVIDSQVMRIVDEFLVSEGRTTCANITNLHSGQILHGFPHSYFITSSTIS